MQVPTTEHHVVELGVLERPPAVDPPHLGDVGDRVVGAQRCPLSRAEAFGGLLESGVRTSTLTAGTPVRLAVAAEGSVDSDALEELASGHCREEL